MTIDRRILIDPRGSDLATRPTVTSVRGMHRASNETRRVFETWCRHKQDGRLPRLADLYPDALHDLLASILVVDVLEAEQDYRYRIVGTLEVETRMSDPTGHTVREYYGYHPESLTFCLENYDLAVASAWGVIDFSVEASTNPDYLELETLLLPLSEDGTRVTQVLVYSHYVPH